MKILNVVCIILCIPLIFCGLILALCMVNMVVYLFLDMFFGYDQYLIVSQEFFKGLL